jgi:pSer/pThr/pTyr-binding forkhead associated (FHA) protein
MSSLTYREHLAFFERQQRRRRRRQFELDDRCETYDDEVRAPAPNAPRDRTETVHIPPAPTADSSVRLILRIKTGKYAGREFVLTDGTYTIGRAEESDFVLVDDTVSDRHAELVVSSKRTTVKDLGSTNGTRLGDTKLRGVAILNGGDRLFLGATELVVEAPP